MAPLLRIAILAGLCAGLAFIAPPVFAQGTTARAAVEAQFRDWLTETVWPDAHARGVSRETFDRALASVALDWALPDLKPPGSAQPQDRQHQAEFLEPGRYFAESRLAALAAEGRNLLRRWAPVLDSIERRYGVPREIVVAIWGRESGFGRVSPRNDAIRVLATQAFMGRRRDLYYPELLAGLAILQEGLVPQAELLSSWAGAMGQPQFLPSKVLRHAVDGDGDGRRDIWRSAADSLASIANFLHGHGWQRDQAWGMEVRVPPRVSCTLEGPQQGRPVRDWMDLGVLGVTGAPLAADHRDAKAHLLMPAGRFGPAFLVSENFYVLKHYNESDLYALFIGHLADRMRGGSPIAGSWRSAGSMTRGDIRAAQERLMAEGYDVGGADGLVGFATRTALGQWQAKSGRDETCFPDPAVIRALLDRKSPAAGLDGN
jgi:lytic murein transglycosylase